jgi:hypothetical protein
VHDQEQARSLFDQQVAEVAADEDAYRARGILLTSIEFPVVTAVFCAPRLQPPVVVFGVKFDYGDATEEPSLVLMDPFANRPYPPAEVPVSFRHAVPSSPPVPAGFPVPRDAAEAQFFEYQSLLRVGTTGDSYMALPETGETTPPGAAAATREPTLAALLETLHKYGAEPISGYRVDPSDGNLLCFVQDRVPGPDGDSAVRVPLPARVYEGAD